MSRGTEDPEPSPPRLGEGWVAYRLSKLPFTSFRGYQRKSMAGGVGVVVRKDENEMLPLSS